MLGNRSLLKESPSFCEQNNLAFGGREEMDAISAVGIFLHRFEKRGGWNTGMKLRRPSSLASLTGRKIWGARSPHTRLNEQCILIGCLCLPQFIPPTDWSGPSAHVRAWFRLLPALPPAAASWNWLGSGKARRLASATISFFLIKQMNHNPN